jgi:hypothetical protein
MHIKAVLNLITFVEIHVHLICALKLATIDDLI